MSVEHDLEEANRLLVAGLADAALAVLWPWREVEREPARGRVRALLGRAHLALGVQSLVLAHGEAGLDQARAEVQTLISESEPGGDRLEAMRVKVVLETLAECDWVQSVAAEALGISKFQMHRLLRKHGLLESVRGRRVQQG